MPVLRDSLTAADLAADARVWTIFENDDAPSKRLAHLRHRRWQDSVECACENAGR